ncbi:MAG: protein kinase [Cyanobacteria bacterium HKST-UBA02]|nr:protein kinase [Cyanobacteria bacterium HKST-UBA02]
MESQEKLKDKASEPRLREVSQEDTVLRTDAPSSTESKAIGGGSQAVIGSTLAGNIYVEELIGKGGMSSVFKGRHTQIDRPVAVKVMHEHLVSEENALLRFQKEAQAAGKLDHPNIVKVADFRVGEGGFSFLVMDYVPGVSLAQAIRKQGVLSCRQAVDIFSQACDALQHAHSHGVIHRDLKPSNIMLVDSESEDGKPQVKLLDFGIAKILPQHGGSGQKLTQTGEVFGSPLYMSPEQCMGKPLDVRSDIYSMGCLMYETLTGTPPIVGANTFETFFKHTTEMPASIKTHRSDLPNYREIDAIILKAMAKNPADRYQSMAELKVDLLALFDEKDRGILEKARDNVELARRRGSARKAALPMPAMIAGLIILVALAAAGSALFLKQPGWQELYTEGQERVDAGQYEKASRDFQAALALSSPDKKSEKAVLRELRDLALIAGENPENFDRELKSRRDQDLSQAREDLSALVARFDRSSAAEKIQVAHDINEKIAPLVYGDADDRSLAGQTLDKTIAALEAGPGKISTAMGRSLHNRAFIDYVQGRYEKSKNGFARAADVYRQIGGTGSEARSYLLYTLQWLASAAGRQGDHDLEKKSLEEKLALSRSSASPGAMNVVSNNVQVAMSKLKLAEFYFYGEKGKYQDLDRALENAREALRIFENAEEKDPVQLANTHYILGAILLEGKDLSGARENLLESVRTFETLKERDSGCFVEALRLLGQTYENEKKPELALPLYIRALAIGLGITPQPQASIEALLLRLDSEAVRGSSTYRQVIFRLMNEKLRVDRERAGKKSEAVVRDLRRLADLNRRDGRLERALELVDEALALKPSSGWLQVGLLTDRALYLFDAKKKTEAEETIARARLNAADLDVSDDRYGELNRLKSTIEARGLEKDFGGLSRKGEKSGI